MARTHRDGASVHGQGAATERTRRASFTTGQWWLVAAAPGGVAAHAKLTCGAIAVAAESG